MIYNKVTNCKFKYLTKILTKVSLDELAYILQRLSQGKILTLQK